MALPANTEGCTVITATGKVIFVGTGDKGVLIVDDTGTVPVMFLDETSDEDTVNLYVDLDRNAALFKPGDDPTAKMVSDFEILRHRRPDPDKGNVRGGFPKHRAEKSAVLVIVREGIVHSATTVRGTEDEINEAFIQTCKQNGLRKDWTTLNQEGADDGPNLDDGYWKPSWDGSINLVWPQVKGNGGSTMSTKNDP